MRTRPTFERLPVRGYQDNLTVDAVLQYYDEKLVSTGTFVETLYTRLDPLTCPASYLDWLAFLVGMVPPYYSYSWKEPVKRNAIASANTIFKQRGTVLGVKKALDIHGFTYTLYTSNDLKLPFIFGATTSKFGKVSDVAFITLPLAYPRNGYEFRETAKVVDSYTAVVAPVRPCYEKFYLGFSVFNDPLL